MVFWFSCYQAVSDGKDNFSICYVCARSSFILTCNAPEKSVVLLLLSWPMSFSSFCFFWFRWGEQCRKHLRRHHSQLSVEDKKKEVKYSFAFLQRKSTKQRCPKRDLLRPWGFKGPEGGCLGRKSVLCSAKINVIVYLREVFISSSQYFSWLLTWEPLLPCSHGNDSLK